MARKKKQEIKEEQTTAKTSSGINYQGNVKITLKKGNKIISSKTYHNAGGSALFKFLLNCIGGDYAENDRPKYIRLFYCSKESPEGAIIDENSTGLSSYIALNKIGYITESSTDKIILHFTIPCAFITTTGEQTEVNQAGLYSKTNTESEALKTNYSACYNFTDGSSWDPIKITSTQGDYNVFIEWTMSFN